ncbi:MAG: hypothetical protein FD167_329 [bacterium]|nr:MAG: hypothetical protein FD167_329 [bacterium]
MSVYAVHPPKDSNFCDEEIKLLPYVFYVGQGTCYLKESIFYRDLPHQQYKQWLEQEIDAKTDVYKALISIKQAVLAEKHIIFVCSCPADHPVDCMAITIRKAILYLLVKQLAFGTPND